MSINAEYIAVGSELLSGAVIESNGAEAARVLGSIGGEFKAITVVGDVDEDMDGVVAAAVKRSSLVIVSGGLGPTLDDRTRFSIARIAGEELVERADLIEDIRNIFERYGSSMSETNKVQALLPASAKPLPNPIGTAPGFFIEIGGAKVFALPGVKREFARMMREEVLSRVVGLYKGAELATRVLHLSGLGESQVGEKLADLMETESNPTVGLLSSPGEVKVVITARGPAGSQRDLIAGVEARVRERIDKFIFGVDGQTNEGVTLDALAARKMTIFVEESFRTRYVGERFGAAGRDNHLGHLVVNRAVSPVDTGGEEDPVRIAIGEAHRVRELFGSDVGVFSANSAEMGLADAGDEKLWAGIAGPDFVAGFSSPVLYNDLFDRQRLGSLIFYKIRSLVI